MNYQQAQLKEHSGCLRTSSFSIVRNMLVKEYIGPEMKGFDPAGELYTKFLRSIGKRKEIGFAVRRF